MLLPALKLSSSDDPEKSYKARTTFLSCKEGGFRIFADVEGELVAKFSFDFFDVRRARVRKLLDVFRAPPFSTWRLAAGLERVSSKVANESLSLLFFPLPPVTDSTA